MNKQLLCLSIIFLNGISHVNASQHRMRRSASLSNITDPATQVNAIPRWVHLSRPAHVSVAMPDCSMPTHSQLQQRSSLIQSANREDGSFAHAHFSMPITHEHALPSESSVELADNENLLINLRTNSVPQSHPINQFITCLLKIKQPNGYIHFERFKNERFGQQDKHQELFNQYKEAKQILSTYAWKAGLFAGIMIAYFAKEKECLELLEKMVDEICKRYGKDYAQYSCIAIGVAMKLIPMIGFYYFQQAFGSFCEQRKLNKDLSKIDPTTTSWKRTNCYPATICIDLPVAGPSTIASSIHEQAVEVGIT